MNRCSHPTDVVNAVLLDNGIKNAFKIEYDDDVAIGYYGYGLKIFFDFKYRIALTTKLFDTNNDWDRIFTFNSEDGKITTFKPFNEGLTKNFESYFRPPVNPNVMTIGENKLNFSLEYSFRAISFNGIDMIVPKGVESDVFKNITSYAQFCPLLMGNHYLSWQDEDYPKAQLYFKERDGCKLIALRLSTSHELDTFYISDFYDFIREFVKGNNIFKCALNSLKAIISTKREKNLITAGYVNLAHRDTNAQVSLLTLSKAYPSFNINSIDPHFSINKLCSTKPS